MSDVCSPFCFDRPLLQLIHVFTISKNRKLQSHICEGTWSNLQQGFKKPRRTVVAAIVDLGIDSLAWHSLLLPVTDCHLADRPASSTRP